MPEVLVTLISGIILLLFSTKTLIKLSESLSSFLRLSPLFIGMTVVAIGTSLPELSVSTIASLKHDYDLAIGNIVGSNIANILLIFGVGILIGNIRIGTTKTPRNTLLVLLITFIYSLTHYFDFLPRKTLGFFFVSISILISLAEYKWALYGRSHEDSKKLKARRENKFTAGNIILLLISIFGIIIGGLFIVRSVSELSSITGLSTGILGLTLTAIATSLPELLTTIFSQEKHEEKITIGNVIGSNLYNLLLIGGLVDLLGTTAKLSRAYWLELNLATILFTIIIFKYRGKIIPKRIGAFLFVTFIAYLYFLSVKI